MSQVYSYQNLFTGNPQVSILPKDVIEQLEDTYFCSINPSIFRAYALANSAGTTDAGGLTSFTSGGFTPGTPILIFQMKLAAWLNPGFTITSLLTTARITFSSSSGGIVALASSTPAWLAGQVDFSVTQPISTTAAYLTDRYNPVSPILVDPRYSTGGLQYSGVGAVTSTYSFNIRGEIDYCILSPRT